MKAVGVFGGSFDPIHIGHLKTSYEILGKRNLEKIIFVPCHIAPHKQDQLPTEDHHRLNMINLAIESYPYFEVFDFEIQEKTISYTYNTLLELKNIYSELELIIGFDNLITFDKWYHQDDILDLAKVIVMKREVDNIPILHNKYFDSAIMVDTTLVDVSSTEIREKVNKGLSINSLVPPKVKDYIFENRLYI
jgi:nicotinate-nucleotide adenylyltransferase